jgi:hypothetical protein
MCQYFSPIFELALIAIQLDPEAVRSGNKAKQLSALEAANAFLLQAKEAREALDQGGFVEAVERGQALDALDRARAQRGEPSHFYVRLPSGEFDELLTAEGAPRELLRKKERAHLNRFEQLGYEFYPLEGEQAGGRVKGAIILKEFVRRYARSESELLRSQERERARERRARAARPRGEAPS